MKIAVYLILLSLKTSRVLAVCPRCPFDYTAFVLSGKVGIPLTGFITLV